MDCGRRVLTRTHNQCFDQKGYNLSNFQLLQLKKFVIYRNWLAKGLGNLRPDFGLMC